MAQVQAAEKDRASAPAEQQNGQSQDVVDQSIEQIRLRVEELRPMHEEFMKGQHMLDLITKQEETPASAPAPDSASRAPARPRQTARGGGQRLEQFVDLVTKEPGKTVTEYARMLGIDPPNYLYRVASNAEAQGRVKKDGTIYTPVA